MSLQQKIEQTVAVLRQAADGFSPICFANSLGAEDMVLTDLIAKHKLDIEMFSLDTGRLPQETYDLMQEVHRRYGVPLKIYFPDCTAVEEYVAQNGANAFYDSVELRKRCCYIRKVEPLKRALAGKRSWITGMRRDQVSRAAAWKCRRSTPITACRNSTRCWTGRMPRCGNTSSKTMCRTISCTTASTRASAAHPARAR